MKLTATLALPALLLAACATTPPPGTNTTTRTTSGASPAPASGGITNPVLAGDYPDPSVVQIGDTYWATATTSNWGPVFPLLRSKNLTDWQLVGHVFPEARPDWADYYFWAPEISQDGGKIYIYYSAHRKGGNLCVGVASASKPEGPYRDHGPLVGQPAGSIDGFPVRSENGRPYLVWKEDGNSVNQPTPIWAQEMNAERTALVGGKKELLRNTAAWEGNLIEGPSIVRHDGYFYMFYAGNGCCGRGCAYATGVARARSLLGPWEKYEQNPILIKNNTWTCPGHGTAVRRGGRWYLLHHAYQTGPFENAGRQGVLSEFVWTKAGWPEFLNQRSTPAGPLPAARAAALAVADEFDGAALGLAWQWPVEDKPTYSVSAGQLRLQARPGGGGATLGRSTAAADYTASTTLLRPATLATGASAGLAALGDPANSLLLAVDTDHVRLLQTKAGKQQTLAQAPLMGAPTAVQLRYQAQGGNRYRFAWSLDGQTWQPLPAGGQAVAGDFLPPWDRGVRAGLVARGPVSAIAIFERFALSTPPGTR